IYAAEALAKKGGLEAVKALSEALENDAFWGVRLEVAKQLSEVKLDQAGSALVKGLSDKSSFVRRAVVNVLANIKTLESYNAIKQLVTQKDESYYVESAAASSLGTMMTSATLKEQEDEVIGLLSGILRERAGWNEVVRVGAIAGLSQLKSSPVALDLILEYTRPGINQALRLAAIRALGTISTGQTASNVEWILEQLADIAKETFFLTQVSVVMALGQMETAKAIPVLQSLANQTPDGRVRRIAEEAVQKVQKNVGTDQSVKQLREELDLLKQENQGLKSRVETLEAKSQLSSQ
ncbi:MAG TPA: HEAT repeat domain-containing protein, partial [Phormidium sp.]